MARHAGASRVELALDAAPRAVTLVISDDGSGGVLHEGAGIRGMRERALLSGADLAITSSPGRGTEVRLIVPLPARVA